METIDSYYIRKGNSLCELEKYEEAIVEYDKVIEHYPDNPNGYYSKGCALRRLNKYEEAIENFDKSLELDPDRFYAYYRKSIALYELGKYEEAIEACDKAIEPVPSDPVFLKLRNKILKKLNKEVKDKRNIEMANNLLKSNLPSVNLGFISKVTGLSNEEILKLKSKTQIKS